MSGLLVRLQEAEEQNLELRSGQLEQARAEAQAARGRARQHGGLWGDLLHDPSRPGSLWGLGLPGGAMVRSRTTATCRGCKSRNIPGIHNLLQYQEVIPLTV